MLGRKVVDSVTVYASTLLEIVNYNVEACYHPYPFCYNLISVQGQQYVRTDKLVLCRADKHPRYLEIRKTEEGPIGMEARPF